MINFIIGPKGSGKTKLLAKEIDMAVKSYSELYGLIAGAIASNFDIEH